MRRLIGFAGTVGERTLNRECSQFNDNPLAHDSLQPCVL
jgi:hypothetical protein